MADIADPRAFCRILDTGEEAIFQKLVKWLEFSLGKGGNVVASRLSDGKVSAKRGFVRSGKFLFPEQLFPGDETSRIADAYDLVCIAVKKKKTTRMAIDMGKKAKAAPKPAPTPEPAKDAPKPEPEKK